MSLSDKIRSSMERIKNRTQWIRRPEVLLGSQIPKPLHQLAPRTILGTKWWNKIRQEAYRSTGYHCVACGVHKSEARYRQWMEAHELYVIDFPKGRMTYIESVPLCHLCHNYIHCGRLAALLQRGEVSQAKYVAVITHGDRVLQEANLVKTVYRGPVAEWGAWRLILFNKEYKPLHKTLEEWKEAHGY